MLGLEFLIYQESQDFKNTCTNVYVIHVVPDAWTVTSLINKENRGKIRTKYTYMCMRTVYHITLITLTVKWKITNSKETLFI